jgi:hypothetical protein
MRSLFFAVVALSAAAAPADDALPLTDVFVSGDIDMLLRRSTDGGDSWSESTDDEALVELVCQASLDWLK